MASTARAAKRIKTASVSKEKKPVTSVHKQGFDASDVTVPTTHAKMTFKSPVTIETVFNAPSDAQVRQFYSSRCSSGTPFDHLPEHAKLAWTTSLHDVTALIGYIVYAQVFPSQLRNRIKLNTASYHYNALDGTGGRGQIKLRQRQEALARLKKFGSATSVFYGLPYSVDKAKNILQFMKMDFDEDDERHRFFLQREFSVIYGERGAASSSSVYSSCSAVTSLLHFCTVILGRPCSLESVILPISVTERRSLELLGCPPSLLDGPIKRFETSWSDVFSAVGTSHRTMDYVMMERASSDKYVEGLHVADAFAVFRATKSAPHDTKSITTLVENYRRHAKKGFETGAVVACCDVLRERPAHAIGRIDGAVIGAISSTYGQQVSQQVRARCLGLQDGAHSLFDASVSNKLHEVVEYFDSQLYRARKKHKMELTVNANLDPAGLNSKISGGKMLDPTDPKSVELMYGMLKGLSKQVWRPLKAMIGEALGANMEYPGAFLASSSDESARLYEHAREAGATYTYVANLYTLLLLSFAFQRSQVLRDSTVHEFTIVPDGTHYKQTFKGRAFKSSTASASSGSLPVSHFNHSPDQSMIIKFLASVGHRFCDNVRVHDEKRRLLLNSKGEGWTQSDIGSRFKKIGAHWLGIPNFSPHVCRSFWASHALNSGQVGPENVDDFSSFLQVSSATLRNSYMGSGAHSAAHKIGSSVLGGVVNSACTGEVTEKSARPSTKKLGARRMEFVAQIRASVLKNGGKSKSRLLFRDLVSKRKASLLGEGERWFLWNRTYFDDDGEKFFKRFIDAHVRGVP